MGDNKKKAKYTAPTGFRLSPVVKEKLDKISKWEGVDMAAVVRRLINEEYARNKDEIEHILLTNDKNKSKAAR